jgi:hypothetical protein
MIGNVVICYEFGSYEETTKKDEKTFERKKYFYLLCISKYFI